MNEITVFQSEQFGSVRTLEDNGKILFCGKDCADALGYQNTRKALGDHCPCVTKRYLGVRTGQKADGSPAIQQVEMAFIPEGDLYRLITHSRLPAAQEFERWVFDEVLPSIRKTGGYMPDMSRLLEQMQQQMMQTVTETVKAVLPVVLEHLPRSRRSEPSGEHMRTEKAGVRMTREEAATLNECTERLNASRTEVLMRGLSLLKDQLDGEQKA